MQAESSVEVSGLLHPWESGKSSGSRSPRAEGGLQGEIPACDEQWAGLTTVKPDNRDHCEICVEETEEERE